MANGRKSGVHGHRDVMEDLLKQSQKLRDRSEDLAREVKQLREQIAKLDGGRVVERRKKPRLKGK